MCLPKEAAHGGNESKLQLPRHRKYQNPGDREPKRTTGESLRLSSNAIQPKRVKLVRSGFRLGGGELLRSHHQPVACDQGQQQLDCAEESE
jgi:hypothetical protein